MKKGFTLIELLVVISIISLLSSIVFSSLQDARARARDAQRISDMKQYQVAIEQDKYAGLPAGYLYIQPGSSWYSAANTYWVESGYLPSIPVDPLWELRDRRDGYMYWNGSDHAWFIGDTDLNTYTVRFLTETATELGPAGYYCLTSAGFHPYSQDRPSPMDDSACEQK